MKLLKRALLLVPGLLLLMVVFPLFAHAANYTIQSGGIYGDLQSAIDDCVAGTAYVIEVDASDDIVGTIIVGAGQNITIKGAGSGVTLTHGSKATYMFQITDAKVTFENITLDGVSHTGTGIALDGADAVLTFGSGAVVKDFDRHQTVLKGAAVYATNQAEVIVRDDAKITGNWATGGSAIYAVNGVTVTVTGAAEITDNKNNTNHENICGSIFLSRSELYLNGDCKIERNESKGFGGGGVYAIDNSYVEMNGNSSVSYNDAGTFEGGGLKFIGSTFVMNGGSIDYNTGGLGGGVCISGSTAAPAAMTINSGSISNNEAIYVSSNGGGGGGIYLASATELVMYGGKINYNECSNEGGGILCGGSGGSSYPNVTIYGGEISHNTSGINAAEPSSCGGGGIYVMRPGSKLRIEKCTLEANTSTAGGGIFMYYGTLEIAGQNTSDVKIINNISTGGGGGIQSLGSGVKIDIDNCTISGNKAATNGGGISYRNSYTEFKLKDAVIRDNEALGYGGGVYVNSSSTLTMSSGMITGNSALRGGGVYVGADSVFTMTSDVPAYVPPTIFGNSAGPGNVAGGGDDVFATGSGTTVTVMLPDSMNLPTLMGSNHWAWMLDNPAHRYLDNQSDGVYSLISSDTDALAITMGSQPNDPNNPGGDPNWEGFPALNKDDHFAYIHGYPDGTVRIDNSITRAEAATIFYNLLLTKDTASGGRFSDVSDEAWYTNAINYLASLGVLNGYPDGSFRPNNPITRAEFAAITAKFDKLESTDVNVFPDVPADHWALSFINSAYIKGWVSGYPDGTFCPEQNITRAEVVSVVNKILNRAIDDAAFAAVQNPYSDIERLHWAYRAVLEASITHEYTRRSNGTEIWSTWAS